MLVLFASQSELLLTFRRYFDVLLATVTYMMMVLVELLVIVDVLVPSGAGGAGGAPVP